MFRQTHVELIGGKRCIVSNRSYAHLGSVPLRRVKPFTARMNAIQAERKD